MTSIIKPKIPAYKTQWDPVASDIHDATGIGVGVNTQLCLSYLFSNSVFRGAPEFVSYFQENDALEIPAGQELAIWDISPLNHDLEEEHPWMIEARQNKKDLTQRALQILEGLVSVLGKRATLAFSQTGTCSVDLMINRSFSMICSLGYTLRTKSGDLHIRITDLYRTMVACGIPSVKFTSEQEVNVLRRKGEVEELWKGEQDQNKKAETILSSVFRARIPSAMVWSISFGKVSLLGAEYPSGALCLKIKGDKFELTLRDTFSFSSAAEFRERLLLGKLEVPPNQKLVLVDERLPLLFQEYQKIKRSGIAFATFPLDQMLLSIGETCEWETLKTEGELNVDWSQTMSHFNNRLEISSSEGFILKRGSKDLFVNLNVLGNLLISERRSSFFLKPDQQLCLYDLTASEIEMLNKEGLAGLSHVLARRNPLGFIWTLNSDNEFTISYTKMRAIGTAEEPLTLIKLSSPVGFTLRLDRPIAEVFIANIVNHSHPALLEGLKEHDPKAMMFLLFRAFFYYLCEDFRVFRSDELPPFFRSEEHRLLVPNGQGRMQTEGVDPIIVTNNQGEVFQLIDESTVTKIQQKMNDTELADAIIALKGVEENWRKMLEILAMSPEQFDQLSLDKLPAPVQLILKAIRPLSEKEMRKSPFIHQHLPAFLASLAADKSTDKKDEKKA